jgi:hypothetical protein
MAKQAYVYSGTDWVPLASEVTNLTAYQTRALAQAPYRNIIINGAMQVWQRNTSFASISSGENYTVDRFNSYLSGTAGTWTLSRESDAPTGSGFRYSWKALCTTASASPNASAYFDFSQKIEGQNLQQIKKGTASAEQLTVSFWVKSNVTGTYIINLSDIDNTRGVAKSYTISSSATWEYKTVTFPADTTGVLDNDNGRSLDLRFGLVGGSDWTSGTLQQTWATQVNTNMLVGQTNLASATNNYWQVTGVQLEVGDTATPFEFKPFAQDLAECQRYYQKTFAPTVAPGNNVGTSGAIIGKGANASAAEPFAHWALRVSMRSYPDVTTYNVGTGTTGQWSNGSGTVSTAARVVTVGPEGISIDNTGNTLAAGTQYYIHASAVSEL